MTITSIQPTISTSFGELYMNGDVWNATFSDKASDAISAIDWNGTHLEVTFRYNNNQKEPYSYSVCNDAQNTLLQEVLSVLTCESVDASIGSCYNQLLKAKHLILVN